MADHLNRRLRARRLLGLCNPLCEVLLDDFFGGGMGGVVENFGAGKRHTQFLKGGYDVGEGQPQSAESTAQFCLVGWFG